MRGCAVSAPPVRRPMCTFARFIRVMEGAAHSNSWIRCTVLVFLSDFQVHTRSVREEATSDHRCSRSVFEDLLTKAGLFCFLRNNSLLLALPRAFPRFDDCGFGTFLAFACVAASRIGSQDCDCGADFVETRHSGVGSPGALRTSAIVVV